MTETIAIRPLAAHDFEGFIALMKQFYEFANNPQPSVAEIRTLFDTALAGDRNFYVFVADAGRELAGLVSVTFAESSYKVAPFAWCDDLYVASAFRRCGLGQRLMEAAGDRARDAGCSCVLLGVGLNEDETLAFYRRLGFVDLNNKLFSLPL